MGFSEPRLCNPAVSPHQQGCLPHLDRALGSVTLHRVSLLCAVFSTLRRLHIVCPSAASPSQPPDPTPRMPTSLSELRSELLRKRRAERENRERNLVCHFIMFVRLITTCPSNSDIPQTTLGWRQLPSSSWRFLSAHPVWLCLWWVSSPLLPAFVFTPPWCPGSGCDAPCAGGLGSSVLM